MQADASRRTQRVIPGAGPTEEDRRLYSALGANAAKGVAVVTAHHGVWDNAVTVTDYLSVSYDPPTLLVSLYSLSRMAETVAEAGRWGLSVLAADQGAVADALGEQGSPLVGLLGQIPHFRRDPDGPALIDGALAWFELRTANTVEAATHTLVVGEVVAMGTASSPLARPLIRFRSEYLR
ncbi:flavin reductase family protein [Leifsonia poae]|uniref:flavin reductase family protein n=1 Tax=Leifsonia poae TaxID=110933 RepID=UPI001CBAC2BD|nr:flavin reductase family protein [Leifsonia poae]